MADKNEKYLRFNDIFDVVLENAKLEKEVVLGFD